MARNNHPGPSPGALGLSSPSTRKNVSPENGHSQEVPPMKRRRLSSDIDGERSQAAKKKRRLRLLLITSRLSPPFSIPATYIVSRGTSKIAVWARQKVLGRGSLHKAAIMNRVQRRELQLKDRQPWRRELGDAADILPASPLQHGCASAVVFPECCCAASHVHSRF
ncbi:hypothetical protein VTN77DRAFT_3762 [Rasamsonia byssochlamydoides]|uniref:uncharacterized protein n=1 Tax=Rasamsonia byssochlamydoides TaxID=89139 RepID=UPI003743AF63